MRTIYHQVSGVPVQRLRLLRMSRQTPTKFATNNISAPSLPKSTPCRPRGRCPWAQSVNWICPGSFMTRRGDYFLSIKQFSYTLTKTEVLAACCLHARKIGIHPHGALELRAVEIWLRDTCICRMDAPQYKTHEAHPLHGCFWKRGDNLFLLRMTCLGARDTRNMLGLERLDHEAGVTCILPHGEHSVFYENGQAYLGFHPPGRGTRCCCRPCLYPNIRPIVRIPPQIVHGRKRALFFIPQGNGEFIHGSPHPRRADPGRGSDRTDVL